MSTFLIKDIRLFTGEEEIENGFVLVQDGIISAAGNDKEIPQYAKSQQIKTISKPNHTLLPGLIDAHIHADKGKELALYQALRFGVTTVMDMHNEPVNVAKLKKIAREDNNAADFKSAGVAATIDNGWPVPVVTAHDKSPETLAEVASWPKLKDPADAEPYVSQNIKDGADYIKLMHESGAGMGASFAMPSLELQSALIDAAHAHGKKAVAHALSYADTLAILSAGIDGLTHTFYDRPPTDELVAAYKKNNAWCNPTLATIGSLTTEGKGEQERFAKDERVQGLLGEAERERLCQCIDFKTPEARLEYAYESVRMLRAAGVDIICGSDAATPARGTAWGLSIHHELYLFVHKIGFTPAEALRSATSLTAERFGFSDRGRIARGCKADLLLVEGNPLKDIDATLNLRGVWRDGVLCMVVFSNQLFHLNFLSYDPRPDAKLSTESSSFKATTIFTLLVLLQNHICATMPDATEAPPVSQAFRFLSLPPELRNRIYRHVFTAKDETVEPFYYDRGDAWLGGYVARSLRYDVVYEPQPAVTKISRQVRSEALPLYYGSHVFFMNLSGDYFNVFNAWVKVICQSYSASLQHIRVQLNVNTQKIVKHHIWASFQTTKVCSGTVFFDIKLSKDRTAMTFACSSRVTKPPTRC